MHRIFLILVLLCLWTTIISAQNAYLLCALEEQLWTCNPTTLSLTPHVVTTGITPDWVAVSPHHGVVVNSGSGNLTLFDPISGTYRTSVLLAEGSNPYQAVIADDSLAWVTLYATNEIALVNLNAAALHGVFPTGPVPQGLAKVGDEIWVGCVDFDAGTFEYGPGRIYIHGPDGAARDSFFVGVNPQTIVPLSNGEVAIIATGDYAAVPGRIYFVDPTSRTILDSLTCGGTPGGAAANREGMLYVSAGGWGGPGTGQVLLTDALTHRMVRDAEDPISVPEGAYGLAALDDGSILVACFSADSLARIVGEEVTDRVAVGDGPASIAVWTPGQGVAPRGTDAVGLVAWPNPFRDRLTLQVPVGTYGTDGTDGAPTGYDALGQIAFRLLPTVKQTYSLPIGPLLPTGSYLLTVTVNGEVHQIRLTRLAE